MRDSNRCDGVNWRLLDTSLLVEPGKLKSVPGRKTDVLDCQWIQQLHTYGLLTGSFRPDSAICVLRSYMRQRAMLVANASEHIQRMQKAMMEMNVQLHHVIADITGTTGLTILDAILAGNRKGIGRELARGAFVCTQAGVGTLPILWHEACRTRLEA